MFVYPQQKLVETHHTPPDRFSFWGEYNELEKASLSFYFIHSCNYLLFFCVHTVLLDKYVYKHIARLSPTQKNTLEEPQEQNSASQPGRFMPPPSRGMMGIRQHLEIFMVVTTGEGK